MKTRMKYIAGILNLLILGGLTILVTACDHNDDPPKPTPLPPEEKLLGGEGNVLIGAIIKNADGMSGSSYFLQMPAVTGTITLKNAIQAGFSSTMTVVGNDVYIFPEFGKEGTQKITRYERTYKGLKKAAERQIIPGSYPQHLIYVNPEKAYIPLYTLGRVEVVHPKTLEKTGEIDLKEYAHGDASCEPAHGIMRDGLYYLPLDQLNDSWMPHADHRRADLVVIDPTTDRVVHTTSEDVSGLCFPTRPMLKGMIFTDEQNDIYIACAGYFGYDASYLKSGFICIPSGSKDFDASKSWDISNTPIQGTEYKPSTVYNTCYLGNGKVAAYVGVLELTGGNPYTARNAISVIIDLKQKTIKQVKGMPATDGHSVEITYHNGLVYFAPFGENAAGIFTYNPQTEQVAQVLTWNNNIAYIHFFE